MQRYVSINLLGKQQKMAPLSQTVSKWCTSHSLPTWTLTTTQSVMVSGCKKRCWCAGSRSSPVSENLFLHPVSAADRLKKHLR